MYDSVLISFSSFFFYDVQPPAFEPETRESAIKYIEDKYLTPLLDPDEFSVERSGRQWKFDWFDRAEVPLDLSNQTRVVVPQWELPFRRQKNSDGIWDPKFIEVLIIFFHE